MLTGLVVILWLCGHVRGNVVLIIVLIGLTLLVLTRTRTALTGMTAGILVAGLSLIVAKARVRKLFAIGGAVAAVVIMTLSSFITTYLARGQGTEQLTELTGQTKVAYCWPSRVTASKKYSGSGCPTDPSPVFPSTVTGSVVQDQGLFGVAMSARFCCSCWSPLTFNRGVCTGRSRFS